MSSALFTMSIACFLLLSLICSATASPGMAAGCPAGMAACTGHTITSTNQTFEEAGYSVTLNGIRLVAGQPAIIDVGVDNSLVLAGTSAFRGFLLRLGSTGPSTFDALSGGSDSNVQVATVCDDVGGVCHNSNSDKRSITANLKMAESSNDMPLDVTVVVVYSGGVSEYYYTAYNISAQAMSTPVAPPVAAPVAPPSASPSASPVAAPVAPPPASTGAPTNSSTTPSPTSSAMSIGRSCGLTVVANAIAVATIFGPF